MAKGTIQILGYGEDALTYWALRNRLPDIIHQCSPEEEDEDFSVFYRPSFGRGGKTKANFGEFDAIIATGQYLFLVESKWASSSECRHDTVKVRDTQRRRHKIFEWYFENWERDNDWASFAENMGTEFSERFPEKKIAPARSILSRNLGSVLEHAVREDGTKKRLVHLLLFIHPPGAKPPTSIEPDWYKLVKIEYPLKKDSQYFEIA